MSVGGRQTVVGFASNASLHTHLDSWDKMSHTWDIISNSLDFDVEEGKGRGTDILL